MSNRSRRSWRGLRGAPLPIVACLLLVAAGGCRQGMYDQEKYEPLEASAIFDDGRSARQPVEGTVARGHLNEDLEYHTGMTADGKMIRDLPIAVDRRVLARGRVLYDAFCSPCHDRSGRGRGMIVRRGFKQPNSFHIARLRQAQVGYFYDVITNGFGQMSSYAAQLTPDERWTVIAYLRALQFSQHVPLAELPAEVRADLESRLATASAEATGAAAADAADAMATPEAGGGGHGAGGGTADSDATEGGE